MGLVVACGISLGPGIGSVSPTLAGGFLSTVPPGKSEILNVFNYLLLCKQYIEGTEDIHQKEDPEMDYL